MSCRLTGPEQLELWRRAVAGDRAARDALFASVAGIVRQAAGQYAWAGMRQSRDDLEQEGWVAVGLAVSQFDPSHGVKFSTYCRPKVADRIQRWIEANRPAGEEECGERALEESSEASPVDTALVANLLNRLPPVERRVVEWRYGVGGVPERRAAEIAAELGVTVKRVEAILRTALDRMAGRRKTAGAIGGRVRCSHPV